MKNFIALASSVLLATAFFADAAAPAIQLFNGKDLSGWRLYGKQAEPGAGWKVEDGVLKKIAKVRGGDIITTNEFDDFDLTWEWRVENPRR